jgi:hypothetical protein
MSKREDIKHIDKEYKGLNEVIQLLLLVTENLYFVREPASDLSELPLILMLSIYSRMSTYGSWPTLFLKIQIDIFHCDLPYLNQRIDPSRMGILYSYSNLFQINLVSTPIACL